MGQFSEFDDIARRYADAEGVLKELIAMSPNGKYSSALRENQAVWANAARFQQQM
jgi:hypothetical protein